jgi:sugar/nucleoside kinase (ribokinase family)
VTTFDVSVIGELNLDLILYGLPGELVRERELLASDLSITLGSSSAIFAHNLARLGNKVGFSSSIGDDPLGEICLQRLEEANVDLSRVRRLKNKTTGLTVILQQAKERYILTYPGTMYEFGERELDFDYIFSAKHLHVCSYFLQKGLRASWTDILRRAKAAGLTTSLDTNDDPEDRWSDDVESLFKYVDILLPNEREACKLAQVDEIERAADILSKKVSVLVIKRGSQGALARVGEDKYVNLPPEVDMVDPVGAGDSFDAGFIHQFIRGANIVDCLISGNIAGALNVTRVGGTEAFRDSKHRTAFLAKQDISRAASSPVSTRS